MMAVCACRRALKTNSTSGIYSAAGTCASISWLVDVDELIEKVVSWSQCDGRVMAAGVCGSHARGEARPDSDIDFCILTPNPGALLEDRSWIYDFSANARVPGPIEDYKLVQSIRVFYGATEAEFGVTNQAWVELPIDSETAAVINDGLRILYDPEGRLEKAVLYAASIDQ